MPNNVSRIIQVLLLTQAPAANGCHICHISSLLTIKNTEP